MDSIQLIIATYVPWLRLSEWLAGQVTSLRNYRLRDRGGQSLILFPGAEGYSEYPDNSRYLEVVLSKFEKFQL